MNVCEFKKLSVWGYDKFILSTDLVSPSRRLVEEDCLKIHCRVWIEGDLKHKLLNGGAARKNLSEEEKVKRRKEKLATDFSKLLKDSVMTDVAITTSSNTFMAHKAVLSGEYSSSCFSIGFRKVFYKMIIALLLFVARSSVFAAMFSTNMLEKEMNSVEIPDFDDDVVKAMLEYLYTGETELLAERPTDLLQVAEKYDLPGLKEDCEYTIADNLNIDNAAEVLVMAHIYNANVLKPRVIDYINW